MLSSRYINGNDDNDNVRRYLRMDSYTHLAARDSYCYGSAVSAVVTCVNSLRIASNGNCYIHHVDNWQLLFYSVYVSDKALAYLMNCTNVIY